MRNAVETILMQGLALIDDCSPEAYVQTHPTMFGATIGQHYRHVIDHFLCLTSGLLTGEIAYDERARSLALETDLDHARTVTQMLLKFFEVTTEEELKRSCTFSSALDYSDHQVISVKSNIERELAYCVSHAVHHFAIVRLMCAASRVNVPAEFGIAPSTLRHRSTLPN